MSQQKIIKTFKTTCLSCMEEHKIKLVSEQRKLTFKGLPVIINEMSYMCENSGEFYMDEALVTDAFIATHIEYLKFALNRR